MDHLLMSNTKIKLLQQQVAVLSLTVASLKVQIDQLEESVSKINNKMKPIKVYEPKDDSLEGASNNLNIDDSESDGYATEDEPILKPKIKTKVPKIYTKRSNQYVLISEDVLVSEDGNESGYEDSESEGSNCSNEKTFIPVYEETRLNPFDNDRITEELRARATLLEEI